MGKGCLSLRFPFGKMRPAYSRMHFNGYNSAGVDTLTVTTMVVSREGADREGERSIIERERERGNKKWRRRMERAGSSSLLRMNQAS